MLKLSKPISFHWLESDFNDLFYCVEVECRRLAFHSSFNKEKKVHSQVSSSKSSTYLFYSDPNQQWNDFKKLGKFFKSLCEPTIKTNEQKSVLFNSKLTHTQLHRLETILLEFFAPLLASMFLEPCNMHKFTVFIPIVEHIHQFLSLHSTSDLNSTCFLTILANEVHSVLPTTPFLFIQSNFIFNFIQFLHSFPCGQQMVLPLLLPWFVPCLLTQLMHWTSSSIGYPPSKTTSSSSTASVSLLPLLKTLLFLISQCKPMFSFLSFQEWQQYHSLLTHSMDAMYSTCHLFSLEEKKLIMVVHLHFDWFPFLVFPSSSSSSSLGSLQDYILQRFHDLHSKALSCCNKNSSNDTTLPSQTELPTFSLFYFLVWVRALFSCLSYSYLSLSHIYQILHLVLQLNVNHPLFSMKLHPSSFVNSSSYPCWVLFLETYLFFLNYLKSNRDTHQKNDSLLGLNPTLNAITKENPSSNPHADRSLPNPCSEALLKPSCSTVESVSLTTQDSLFSLETHFFHSLFQLLPTLFSHTIPTILESHAKSICSLLFQLAPVSMSQTFLTPYFHFPSTHPLKLTLFTLGLPTLGVSFFLQKDPCLFQSVWEGLHYQGLAGKIQTFVLQWMQSQLDSGLENKINTKEQCNLTSIDPVTLESCKKNEIQLKPEDQEWKKKNQAFQNDTLYMYSKCLIQSLTHPNSKVRKAVQTHLLKPMLKLQPRLYPLLLTFLQMDSIVVPSSPIALVEAWIALERIAVSLSIPSSISAHTPPLSLTLFAQVAMHLSISLRLDVLGAFIETRKTSTPFPIPTLHYLLFFLNMNINDPSPAFREPLAKKLLTMLERIKDSSNALLRSLPSSIIASLDSFESTQQKLNPCDLAQYHVLLAYADFLHQLLSYVILFLTPQCSYPCACTLISILEACMVLLRSSTSSTLPTLPFHCTAFTFEVSKPNDSLPIHPRPPSLWKFMDPLTYFDALAQFFLSTPYDGLRVKLYHLLRHWPLPFSKVNELWTCALKLSENPKSQVMETTVLLFQWVVHVWSQQSPPSTWVFEGLTMEPRQTPLETMFNFQLKRAQTQLSQARDSLYYAALHAPLPTTFRTLACFTSHPDFQWSNHIPIQPLDVFQMVREAYEVVKDAVACDSPEGALPEDELEEECLDEMEFEFNEVEKNKKEGGEGIENESETKMEREQDKEMKKRSNQSQWIVSFSWRVVKEVCGWLSTVFNNLDPSDETLSSFWSEVGNFLIQIMLQLRHRGAFVAVHPILVQLVERVSLHSQLPKLWLEDNLKRLNSIEIILTRRSGGAPFVILALLTPSRCRAYLPWLVSKLFTLCKTDTSSISSVIQVNNINVLRRIFLDSHLSSDTVGYLEKAFLLSITKFTHSDWSVRNAGLMLFSSLVNRIFGTTRLHQDIEKTEHLHASQTNEFVIKQVSGNDFFKRFPLLFDFLLTQFTPSQTDSSSSTTTVVLQPEAAVPILCLLSRFSSSFSSSSSSSSSSNSNDPLSSLSLSKFLPFVMQCATSKYWKLRVMASRTVWSLLPSSLSSEEHALFLYTSLMDFEPSMKENQVHGYLLQLLRFMELCLTSSPSLSPSSLWNLEGWISLIQSLQSKVSHYSLALAYQIFYTLLTISSIPSSLASSSSSSSSSSILSHMYASWFDFHWSGIGSELARFHLLGGLSSRIPVSPLLLPSFVFRRLLNDPDYNVREAALHFGKHQPDSLNLKSILTELAHPSTSLPWCSLSMTSSFLESCMALNHLPWSLDQLFSFYTSSSLLPLSQKQTLLIALGQFMQPSLFDSFYELLSEASMPSSPLPLREAALRSVESYFKHHFVCSRLTFLLMMTLLQDDDVDLRNATAHLLSYFCLVSTISSSSSSSPSNPASSLPPSFHAHALWQYLMLHAPQYTEFKLLRSTLVQTLTSHLPSLPSSSSTTVPFDKEPDNLFKDVFLEFLLILKTLHHHHHVNVIKLLQEIFNEILLLHSSSSTDSTETHFRDHGGFLFRVIYSLAFMQKDEKTDLHVSLIRQFIFEDAVLFFSSPLSVLNPEEPLVFNAA